MLSTSPVPDTRTVSTGLLPDHRAIDNIHLFACSSIGSILVPAERLLYSKYPLFLQAGIKQPSSLIKWSWMAPFHFSDNQSPAVKYSFAVPRWCEGFSVSRSRRHRYRYALIMSSSCPEGYHSGHLRSRSARVILSGIEPLASTSHSRLYLNGLINLLRSGISSNHICGRWVLMSYPQS